MEQENNTESSTLIRAEVRDVTSAAKRALRGEGKLLGELYGHGTESTHLSVGYKEFEALLKQAGRGGLIDLQVGMAKPVKVLVQDIQRDPVKGRLVHVDFYRINMQEKIHTDVSLTFIGASPAVKELGGILIKSMDALKIECLPQYLIKELVVDISALKTFDDAIRVRDLKLPEGVTVLSKADEVITSVQPPRTEAELKALEEAPAEGAAEVEVVGKEGVKAAGEEGVAEDEKAAGASGATAGDKK
ncbi:MAG: 50S ribosomal protein L25 [Patescibacteria group bacterium]